MGAGRARKPYYSCARFRRLAVRNNTARRTAVGVHHHTARIAPWVVRALRTHQWCEGSRCGEPTRRSPGSFLLRLDAARDRRAVALLRHSFRARTVEPAMAPVPIVPQPKHAICWEHGP